MRVICIGECMVELRAAEGEGLQRGFAGDVYNTAVYLKRELPEAEVALLTVTGVDPLSTAMRASWREEGLQEDLAFTVPDRLPGLYLVQTDAVGERRFFYWRGESAARGWLAALERQGGKALLEGALVYLSGISLAILPAGERPAALRLLGSIGAPLAFDPNYRASLWENVRAARDVCESMMGLAKFVLPSLDDLDALWGVQSPDEHLARLTALGAGEVALTLGAQGCLLADRRIDCPPGRGVIDTSGAGDAFNGAYLAARLRGRSPQEAARTGLSLSRRVVAYRGALIPRVPMELC